MVVNHTIKTHDSLKHFLNSMRPWKHALKHFKDLSHTRLGKDVKGFPKLKASKHNEGHRIITQVRSIPALIKHLEKPAVKNALKENIRHTHSTVKAGSIWKKSKKYLKGAVPIALGLLSMYGAYQGHTSLSTKPNTQQIETTKDQIEGLKKMETYIKRYEGKAGDYPSAPRFMDMRSRQIRKKYDLKVNPSSRSAYNKEMKRLTTKLRNLKETNKSGYEMISDNAPSMPKIPRTTRRKGAGLGKVLRALKKKGHVHASFKMPKKGNRVGKTIARMVGLSQLAHTGKQQGLHNVPLGKINTLIGLMHGDVVNTGIAVGTKAVIDKAKKGGSLKKKLKTASKVALGLGTLGTMLWGANHGLRFPSVAEEEFYTSYP